MTAGARLSVWVFGEDGEILTDSATQALIFASSVLVTGTMILSPLIADLATVFDVSEAYAGAVIVGFTAAAAITLPITGALADLLGRRVVLVGGLALFGVAGVAAGTIEWFEAVLGFRVLQGVGFAASMPVILTLFGDLYEGSEEATVQGMRVAVNSAMNAAAPLIAGLLFVYSWRYPFALYVLALPAAAWVWVTIPAVETADGWSFRTYVREIVEFVKEPKIALLMLSFFFRFVVIYGLITYISVLAIGEAGLAVVAVGALLTVNGAVKTLASTQVGRLSLAFGAALLSLVSFGSLVVGTVLMGAVPTAFALVVGVVIWGIGDGVLAPCQKSLLNQLAPPEYRGGAMSTALTFQNVGKVVGPAGLGWLLAVVGPGPAFVALGAIGGGLGIASLAFVWIWDR